MKLPFHHLPSKDPRPSPFYPYQIDSPSSICAAERFIFSLLFPSILIFLLDFCDLHAFTHACINSSLFATYSLIHFPSSRVALASWFSISSSSALRLPTYIDSFFNLFSSLPLCLDPSWLCNFSCKRVHISVLREWPWLLWLFRPKPGGRRNWATSLIIRSIICLNQGPIFLLSHLNIATQKNLSWYKRKINLSWRKRKKKRNLLEIVLGVDISNGTKLDTSAVDCHLWQEKWLIDWHCLCCSRLNVKYLIHLNL